MPIQAVLFDADGVVMNGQPFADTLEQELGLLPEHTASFFEDAFLSCQIGEKDLKDELAAHLPQWGWDKSVDEFLLFWFDSGNVINHSLLTNIRELRKKKITCALATNQEKYRTEYIVDRMYFKDKFDHVIASAHIGSRKPDRAFFEHIDRLLQLPKDAVVFWDDKEENVAAAQEYGFHAFVYTDYKPYQKQMKKLLADK